MRTQAGRFAVVVAMAGLAAACSPTLEQVLAEHRAPAEAVFTKLEGLAPAAQAAPAVGEDGVDVGAGKVVLEGEHSNALFIRAEDLAAPRNATSDAMGSTHAGTVRICGEALRGEFHGAPAGMRAFLTECGRTEYVFVQRTRTEQLATLVATLVGEQSFAPGLYEGDVLLFRLADGALLGGFTVAAESSDEVSVRLDASGNPIDPIDRLNSDLSAEVFASINAKLRQHVPGAVAAEGG
jgi:hypothetical protein